MRLGTVREGQRKLAVPRSSVPLRRAPATTVPAPYHQPLPLALNSLLATRLADADAQRLVREAVAIERSFVCEQLPLGAIGLDAGAMGQARAVWVAGRSIESGAWLEGGGGKGPR